MKLDDCRWQDALEWQMRLWRWSQTEIAPRYLETFPIAKFHHSSPGWSTDPGAMLAAITKATMETADPWWVSPDVAALVAEAAEDMPHDPLVREDIPAPAGFALIGGPALLYPALDGGERNGKKLSMRAISWWTTWARYANSEELEPSMMLTSWAHIEDDDDFVGELREMKDSYRDFGQHMIDLNPTGIAVVPFGDTSMWRPDLIDYSGDTRWTMAFFRFVQQRVIGSDRQYWERSQRREARRSGFREIPDQGYVSAIRLRRISHPEEEGYEPLSTGRKLTSRHIRSGHWRRQWYPKLGLHRPIYIHTTVVGPDGTPLHLRKARGVIVNR